MLIRTFICCLTLITHLEGRELEPNLTVMVPMRDGTELPTDLYFPTEEHEELPCVLIRDPAGRKAPHNKRLLDLTHKGYIIALQDTRSALDSEGKTLPYLSDAWGEQQDGYDAVEWLAKSPLTNGKIGTLGFSAQGITQTLMAPTAPPSLKCQYIGAAASSLYHHALFPGGQLRKEKVEGWLSYYARDPSVKKFVMDQPHFNEFWQGYDSRAVAEQIESPGLHYGGWYDTFICGTVDAFISRQERGGKGARGTQKLLIGPWTHFWPSSTHFGDFPMPTEGHQPPINLSPAAWFDYHLKDIDNALDSLPAVTYYVMGPFDGSASSGNVWRHSDVWPVPAQETAFFLTVNGKLTDKSPASTKYHYSSDPKNPVPTIGGSNLFVESGPKCQRTIEARDDVLLFTTEPLSEDIEVTGQIYLSLFFSCDCEDTDVAVRLTDVYPDGKSILISDGIHRTTKQHSNHDSHVPHEVKVELLPTSMVFAKGHALRISIAGSNYPRYECNCNVGTPNGSKENFVVAQHFVHTGSATPSRLILPIVRRGDQWLAEKRRD